MTYSIVVHIMPRQSILDPQGKATESGLHQLGFNDIHQVRIGKRIEFQLEAADEQTARELADGACRKLLANLIMESYRYEILETSNV
jgi:phosphoribosylformylglycinamidine synthase PurS subunit